MTHLALLFEEAAAAEPAGFLHALRPIDQVGLGIVSLFLVLGAVRGLWWQVIRLLGLLAAGLLARALAPRWSPQVAEASGLAPVVSQGLVWFAVFVLGLAAASLLGMVGKKSLEAMQLGLVDRLGGSLAGVLTGLTLHAALLLGLSYLGPQPWTADTLRGTRSQTLLRLVSTRTAVLLDRDSEAAREIRGWLGAPEERPEQPSQQGPQGEPLEPPPAEGPLEGGAPVGEPAPEAVRPIEANAPRVR
jgi:uncharacterized membrane protein required for colicin V production